MNLKIYMMDCSNIPLDVLLSSSYLSPLEKMSFDKYKSIETKKEKIVSSILKNKYVGPYYISESGKPLSDSKYFNISHSHSMVAIVIDIVPVGIDIEKIRPVEKDLIDYISNEEEKKYIHDDQSFFEIWTNKESLVKSLGSGIKERPNKIPGLPINSKRIYKNEVYYNKTFEYLDYVVSISRKVDEDFVVEFIKEVI